MGAKVSKPKSKLTANLLELFQACPLDHCNPEDCPLFELRGLRPRQRLAWLNALSEEDLSYLASYHYICLATRTAGTSGKRGRAVSGS